VTHFDSQYGTPAWSDISAGSVISAKKEYVTCRGDKNYESQLRPMKLERKKQG